MTPGSCSQLVMTGLLLFGTYASSCTTEKFKIEVCCVLSQRFCFSCLCSMKKGIHASLTVSGHQMGPPLLLQIVKGTLLCMD